MHDVHDDIACNYHMHYHTCMSKSTRSAVREPVQAYLASDDAALLSRLAAATGLSKAEVLRRGIRAFAREQDVPSPMLAFIADQGGGLPDAERAPTDQRPIDDRLAEAYRDVAS